MQDRNQRIQNVLESLEKDLELLCLTGVEDKLQQNVRTTLETLRNAGIKVSTPHQSCIRKQAQTRIKGKVSSTKYS